MDKVVQAEQKLNEEWRRTFHCAKPECVVQVYPTGGVMAKGQLYLSQNYACYQQGKTTAKVAFCEIETHNFGPKNTINIKTNDGQLYAWPECPRPAYTMLCYLSENPTNYIDLNAVREFEEKLAYTQQQQMQTQAAPLPSFDLAVADELLSLALDTDFTQNSLMDTVARQGEQIDRINGTIDRVEAKMDRAEHLLRGIESYRYYVFGKQKGKNKNRETALERRTMNRAPNLPPPVEVEVLLKRADALLPSILSLEQDEFKILDPTTNAVAESRKFAEIDAMVMVVKPEHMHFMIKGAKGPIVIISSYLQVIVNQIHSRSKKLNLSPKVVFHTPARKFEYQDDRVSAVRAAQHTPLADLLSDPGAREQATQLDNTLDQVLSLTQGINAKGRQLNEELAIQNAALAHANNKVDSLNNRARNMNGRLDHQNDKY